MGGENTNVMFRKFIYSNTGTYVSNENNDVLCEVEDCQGTIFPIFLSVSTLEEFGVLNSQDASLDDGVHMLTNSKELSQKCELWKTSKSPTEADNQATIMLLELRKKLENDFANKKTTKNVLWQKIAVKMNEMGFFAGEGVEGREKVRQKFANLQSSYMKFLQRRQQTGEGAVKKPPFFDEIDSILGDKHKVLPPFVIDSEITDDSKETGPTLSFTKNQTTSRNKEDPDEELTLPGISSTESQCNTPHRNRFYNGEKSVRPGKEKEKMIDVVKEINNENMQERRKEFSSLVDLLREENKQRHEEIMSVIKLLQKRRRSPETKRKRENSSDSD